MSLKKLSHHYENEHGCGHYNLQHMMDHPDGNFRIFGCADCNDFTVKIDKIDEVKIKW